uniref:EF-hand domain-containing protein n=1 Tax=Parastrongyloides trichosuri TaxID=131310 RepID=A0A0N5A319_PARTI
MSPTKKVSISENDYYINDDDNTFLTQAEQSKLLHEQALKIFSLCDITNKGFVIPSDLKNLDGIIPNFRKSEYIKELFDKESTKISKQKLNQKEFLSKIKKILLTNNHTFNSNKPNKNFDVRRSSSDLGNITERRPSKKISFYSTSTGIAESEMKEIKFSDSDEESVEKAISSAGNAPIYSEHPTYFRKYPTSPGEASLYDELSSRDKNDNEKRKDKNMFSFPKYKSLKKDFPGPSSTHINHNRSSSFSKVFANQKSPTEKKETSFYNEGTNGSTSKGNCPERIFKVVFVGDSAVGKTCFLQRYCYNQFRQAFNATIGVDFTVKTIIVNDKKITIQLWDTAGQERFRSITKQYFRKANAVVLMYDITSEKSFINVRNWIESVKKGVEDRCIMCLIGNKLDLCGDSSNRAVPYENGKKLADEFGMAFYETSAYTRFNLNECIEGLAILLQLQEEKEMEEALKLESKTFKFPGSWCCL